MKDNTVLILGGYGNAGLAIARLLVSQTKVGIILAGRTVDRAQRAAQQLNAEFVDELKSLNSLVLKNGTWQPGKMSDMLYLDGSLQKPGLWRQATLVEPVRFFEDVAILGVRVNVTDD